jgi:integrase
MGHINMPRSVRAPQLENRTSRLRLAVRRKPYWIPIDRGVSIGYRRNKTAGTWSGRYANGKGSYWIEIIGKADDFDVADGIAVWDFFGAQKRVREIGLAARHDYGPSNRLQTVRQAVDAYRTHLEAENRDPENWRRILHHLPDALAGKTVALLVARDFAPWRDALAAAGLTPASINRSGTNLKAALNYAADQDERITNRSAWRRGLAALPNAVETRNVILDDASVLALVAGSYEVNEEFGLLIETLAGTGARLSQAARLQVADLQPNHGAPRLMIPASRKGDSRKSSERRPVPITTALATRLAAASKGRASDARLLTRPSGEPWHSADIGRPFARVRAAVGLGPEATSYSLRHSSIVRQLLANVPIRVVATAHDTSTKMIEATYSRYIGDHSDVLLRRALLDPNKPSGTDNVVTLAAKA